MTTLQPKIEIFNPYKAPFTDESGYMDLKKQGTLLDFGVSEFIKNGVDDDGNRIVCKCTPCQCCACR